MHRKKPGFLTRILAVVLMEAIALPPATCAAALRAVRSQAVPNNVESRANSAARGALRSRAG